MVSIAILFCSFFSNRDSFTLKALELSHFETAVKWSLDRFYENNSQYNYECLRFVQNAFNAAGVSTSTMGCAKNAANSWVCSTSENAPRGSLVFWDWLGTVNGEYKNWGHVGISIGNGEFVHNFDKKIQKDSISDFNSRYRNSHTFLGYGFIETQTYTNWFINEFYNNKNLEGSPVLIDYENQISHNYGDGSPHSNVNNDFFSIRWQGLFDIEPGVYRFDYRTDDGIRVWLDDNLIIDDWNLQGASNKSIHFRINGTSFNKHKVKCEYFEQQGASEIYLSWTQVSSSLTPTPNDDEVIVFEGSNYQGNYVRLKWGYYPNPSRIGLQNDSISSIKVGRQVQACLFEHDGFDGKMEWISYDDPDLSDNQIGNDSVSSMKVYGR
jgi:hypothetical protein